MHCAAHGTVRGNIDRDRDVALVRERIERRELEIRELRRDNRAVVEQNDARIVGVFVAAEEFDTPAAGQRAVISEQKCRVVVTLNARRVGLGRNDGGGRERQGRVDRAKNARRRRAIGGERQSIGSERQV